MFTLVYFAIVNTEKQAEKRGYRFYRKSCLKCLFHRFEQSVSTASAPSAFCYFSYPFGDDDSSLEVNHAFKILGI